MVMLIHAHNKHSKMFFKKEIQRTNLNALMAAKIEIKLCGMGDTDINSGTRRNVSTFSRLFFFVSAEETSVVAFLYNYKSDARFIVWFQLNARFPHCCQLMLKYL